MGRPARPLAEHIRRGTFRARRHHPLLAGPDVPWPWFAHLQSRYRAATSDPERRAIAVDCERAAGQARQHADTHQGTSGYPSLAQQLDTLGTPGSLKRLLGFFPHFLRHSKGPLHGQPFQLEPWQQHFLRELYRRDNNGCRIYNQALLGLPSGNGKTTLAAGLALYELLSNTDSPEIYLAAASKQQARIGLNSARTMTEHQPSATWIVSTANTISYQPHNGTIEALSSQGALQQGRTPTAVFVDELGIFTTRKQHDTYTTLAAAIPKRPDSYLLATTTTGPSRDSLLGRVHQHALDCDDVTTTRDGCLTIAKNTAAATLLWWYAAPDGTDPENPTILRNCNPASWITTTTLQQRRKTPTFIEDDFRRHHLNQWPAANRHETAGTTTNHDRSQQPKDLNQLIHELNRRYPQTT